MPVSFLNEEQQNQYGRYAGEPSAEQLARFFYLDDTDRELIRKRRGDHMRLGFALQLTTARFLGTFLDSPEDAPAGVIRFLARQLDIADPECLSRYAATKRRWDHTVEIRKHYGYRLFSEPFIQWRLCRWLYALCWTGTDRPSVLFDRATSWLVAGKVLLPGASVLERLIAQVRSRASRRIWHRLVEGTSPEQRERLELLLIAPPDQRQSIFDRLRHGPTLQSVPELVRAIARLAEIKELAHGFRNVERLPNWDELLRLAGSLKLGLVQPRNLMRILQTNTKPTQLARAMQHLGRIIKTTYILRFIDNEGERRRVLTQLNRHEGRHGLARNVFHGGRGELRQRYREGQEDQLNALGLVVNVIILWNTIYMNAALEQLRKEGYLVKEEDAARLSPTMSLHINLLGRYSFTLPETVARGALRPLRNPEDVMEAAA